MKKNIILIMPLFLFGCETEKVFFSNCFNSKSDVLDIAQQLREKSESIGWELGQIKSMTIAGIISAKKSVYSSSRMEVCIKEIDSELKFIMNSDSKEAGDAEWHFLSGTKKGMY